MEYREPATEHSGYCIYDDNGRIITEFSDQADNSSELYEYSYRQDGKLQRKTYIEIDYYSIDWNYPVNDSEFLEDEAYEAVFDSVHLDYDYDDYIYDSKDLLIRIDSYSAGDINPRYYTIFEYDSDNRIIKSFDGWYNKDTIERIMIYEYY